MNDVMKQRANESDQDYAIRCIRNAALWNAARIIERLQTDDYVWNTAISASRDAILAMMDND